MYLSQIYFMPFIRFTEKLYDGSGSISALYYGALGSTVGSKADTTLKSVQEYDKIVLQNML
jgi:hypothetical protein